MTSYAHVKSGVISRILHNEMASDSPYEDAVLASYSSRLAFLLSKMTGPEFDPLTPAPDAPDNDLQALRYVFKPDSWILTTAKAMDRQRPVFSFGYDASVDDLIEPLVTGAITPSLHRLLEKMRYDGWDRGFVKAIVDDLRYETPHTSVTRLRIGDSASLLEQREFMAANSGDNEIEVERLMLLKSHPDLCTDPSPEVARYWSAVDWRAKMWTPAPPRSLPPVPQIEHPPPSDVPRFEHTGTQVLQISEAAQMDWFNLIQKRKEVVEAARKAKQQQQQPQRQTSRR